MFLGSRWLVCFETPFLLSVAIVVRFWPGMSVAALYRLEPMNGFVWASANNIASWEKYDAWLKPVARGLPACKRVSVDCFCNLALANGLWTNHSVHLQCLYLILSSPPKRKCLSRNLCTEQSPKESDGTRCCINTICPPEDENNSARNM